MWRCMVCFLVLFYEFVLVWVVVCPECRLCVCLWDSLCVCLCMCVSCLALLRGVVWLACLVCFAGVVCVCAKCAYVVCDALCDVVWFGVCGCFCVALNVC